MSVVEIAVEEIVVEEVFSFATALAVKDEHRPRYRNGERDS